MSELQGLNRLREDGDTIEISGDRKLRLRIEQDFDTSINDFDHWGHSEEYCHDYRGSQDPNRPDDMDGNAQKLQVGRGEWMWWQPPAGVERGTEEFRTLVQAVRDLLAYGFKELRLELLEGVDAYGRPIVTNFSVLGGVDCVDAQTVLEMISYNLFPDLDIEP